MSCYVVDFETISVLADAMANTFKGDELTCAEWGGMPPVLIDLQETRQNIGQALLKANYESVNEKYNENTECPTFEFKEVSWNEGTILGCIQCYNYQTCEINEYEKTNVYHDLVTLKGKLLERCLRKLGYKVPWGYDGHDTLE